MPQLTIFPQNLWKIHPDLYINVDPMEEVVPQYRCPLVKGSSAITITSFVFLCYFAMAHWLISAEYKMGGCNQWSSEKLIICAGLL